MRWAWQETNVSLSELISCLAHHLYSCALPDSLITLSTLKLRLAVDARWAHRVRLARLLLLALQDFSLFWFEIVKIFSLIPINDTLMIGIETYQDLFTNSYKRTINWGNYTCFEKVFYTKVSRIRWLTIFQDTYFFVRVLCLLQVWNYFIKFVFGSISILKCFIVCLLIFEYCFILKLCALWVSLTFPFEIQYI